MTVRTLTVLPDLTDGELAQQFALAATDAGVDRQPVAVFFYDDDAQTWSARILNDGHVPFDVRLRSHRHDVGAIPVDHVLASATRYASQRSFKEVTAAVAFARTYDLSTWQASVADALDVLAATETSDDHAARCCRAHGTHSSPHVACILR